MLMPFLSLQYESSTNKLRRETLIGKGSFIERRVYRQFWKKGVYLRGASKIGVYKGAFVQGRVFEKLMYVFTVANEESVYVNVKIDFSPREYVNLRKNLREYVNFRVTGGASSRKLQLMYTSGIGPSFIKQSRKPLVLLPLAAGSTCFSIF